MISISVLFTLTISKSAYSIFVSTITNFKCIGDVLVTVDFIDKRDLYRSKFALFLLEHVFVLLGILSHFNSANKAHT